MEIVCLTVIVAVDTDSFGNNGCRNSKPRRVVISVPLADFFYDRGSKQEDYQHKYRKYNEEHDVKHSESECEPQFCFPPEIEKGDFP